MHVIIPARYLSTRLPGKPLLDIAGKTLLERVYARAQASGAARVTIATDDARIRETAESFGAEVCMTSPRHRSGTDRVGEVIAKLAISPDAIVVNLQGDEPLMPASLVREVADTLAQHRDAAVATACHPFSDLETLHNPSAVKVVCDENGYALYFSRAPIPWPRDRLAKVTNDPVQGLRHIGLYAYRAGFVTRFCGWEPCAIEEAEMLEQLRALWHGERIAVHVTHAAPGGGVDTPEDLERVRRCFETVGS